MEIDLLLQIHSQNKNNILYILSIHQTISKIQLQFYEIIIFLTKFNFLYFN